MNGIQEVSGSIPLISTKKLVRVQKSLKIEKFQGFFLSKSGKIAVFAICACSQVEFEVYQEIMLAKRTPVTQQEKENMWQLYNELVSFPKLAKKLNRSPDTVSCYVHEYEAAVNAVCVVIDAQNT